MASFGTMNLNNNLASITYANHLCNAYGFDAISAGATVSFAIECFEKRVPRKEETDGLERPVAEGRGAHHKGASEYMHVVNSAGHCQFVMMAANTANIPEWINMTTGWDMTREELLQVGERIANMRMAFEVREGGNPSKR